MATARHASDTGLSGHIPALDGLRGLAILMVMTVHMTVMTSDAPVDRAFMRLAALGWTGVDLFFVLSGFLITGILVDAKEAPHYFRDFYARRVLRIFPLYYAVAFVSLVLLPRMPALDGVLADGREPAHAWTYWLYISNFASAWEGRLTGGILIVAWSLAIEEQFYMLWAPIVYWLSRAALLRLCVGLIAAALAVRVALVASDVAPVVLYVLPCTRMDALAVGGLIAIVARSPAGLRALTRHARTVGAVAAAAVAAAVLLDRSPLWSGPVMQTLGYTGLAFMFGALLVMAVASPAGHAIRWALTSRPLRTFGKYSYALYLIHLPARRVVRDNFFGPDDFPSLLGSSLPAQMLFYGLGAGLALAVAYVSWHLYEKPLLSLKRYFPMALAPASAAAPGGERRERRSGLARAH